MLLRQGESAGWVLKALREAGNSLLSELQRADPHALRRPPAPGEWCLAEVAGHLRDSEQLALDQLNAILDRARRLPVRDIESLPEERRYSSTDATRMLEEFRGLRRETTSLLWQLSGAEWQRSGAHPYRGDITIEQIARELAQHDLEHLWQVRRTKDALSRESRAG